jgi:hypothetical protein
MARNGTKTSKQGPRFAAALAVWWRTVCRDAFDPYRPELHYMRGPGPKWHAKHGVGQLAADAPTHAAPAAA